MARIKTKFTGVYYINSTTNEKPDKTYYIRYKDVNGKDTELKIGKFSEGIREQYCNVKRNELVTKIRLGEEVHIKYRKKDKLLFSDLADEYFSQRAENKNKQKDISLLNKHLLLYFDENMDLNTITKKNMQAFKQMKLDAGLSPKTVNNILTLFFTIINYALKEELIQTDITKFINKERIDNDRERFLSVVDIKRLYKVVEENKRLYLFCKLSLTTGARLATTLNIRKKDIDFTYKILTLKDFKNNTTYKAFLKDDVVELGSVQDSVSASSNS